MTSDAAPPPHPLPDPHEGLGARLNWLRAGVLGANDGIVSTAGLVVGVAGATDTKSTLLASGIAGLLAGSLSMASGEYVSVSTQRDTEQAALALEKKELAESPRRSSRNWSASTGTGACRSRPRAAWPRR